MDHASPDVVARRGFFPFVTGQTVDVAQAGGRFFIARGDLTLTQGGGQVLVSGGRTTVTEGGSGLLVSAGDVSIAEGGALVAAAERITVRDSFLGVALGRTIEVSDSRILLGSRQAAAFGAAAGVAGSLVLVLTAMLARRGT